MNGEVIEKSMSMLRLKPNLGDYDSAYKSFRWEDAYSELSWLNGGKLNAAYEAIDRHAEGRRKNRAALYQEYADGKRANYTFSEMKDISNKFANVLKNLEIKKGDRVFIFLPRIPELYTGFIGIVKTGAIAATVFAAFGTDALKDRLCDSGAKAILTTPELKKRLDAIKDKLPELKHVILVGGGDSGKEEISYEEEMSNASKHFDVAKTDTQDCSFMLYTSGTTGRPKGVAHTHFAVLQQHMTAKWVLDLHDEDVLWCTADPGWITGISYGILGPWSNGVSSVVYEGRFEPEKWYSLIENYQVSVWYTAPTAVRMLMRAGKELADKYDMSSLRYICSVGEPLNPEAVRWGQKVFRLPIHDNWWQTETGGILIANYPSLPIKPGSMGKPVPGIKAAVIDADCRELPPYEHGDLAIVPPWPSMMKSIWGDEAKYKSYFKNGWYITGDRAFVDEDGYFWFVGRSDDIIKTAGHRVGPFEVESALMKHPAVAEAGVIGKPDPIAGEIIKAFITLSKGYAASKELEDEIRRFVKKHLAGHAYPKEIEIVDSLPKTRSGKIMRRMLKAKEFGLPVGDTSSLEEE